MNHKRFFCPICGLEENRCPHTKEEMWDFEDEQQNIRKEAFDIVREIIRIDTLQDMPVVPEWIDLVQKAKDFLKNNA